MPRLFTGLEIPAEIGQQLALHRGGLPGARWVDPENYHVTLRFIGDIESGMARDVDSVLHEIRAREPVTVTFEELASFGGDKPHAVFAKAAASEELNDLQAEQERLFRRLGLAPERRRFTPHVTLARLRNASPLDVAQYIAMRGQFRRLSFRARRVALFSARESTGGGPYVVEATYDFA